MRETGYVENEQTEKEGIIYQFVIGREHQLSGGALLSCSGKVSQLNFPLIISNSSFSISFPFLLLCKKLGSLTQQHTHSYIRRVSLLVCFGQGPLTIWRSIALWQWGFPYFPMIINDTRLSISFLILFLCKILVP